MLPKFELWLRKHDLLVDAAGDEQRPFLWVTDGVSKRSQRQIIAYFVANTLLNAPLSFSLSSPAYL